MGSDILNNKAQTINRCVKRVIDEYGADPDNLKNYTKQDAIILNILRACEACIDAAMHIIAEKKLGLPQNSRDAFEMLNENGILDNEIVAKLKPMVGFRNIAVHDYKSVNINIVKEIIEKHLIDFIAFANIIIKIDNI
ncbi:MAG TPA: DUF86 domain-containing protein [Clostridiaceae bacterium]